jgi:hypothetical protein
MKLTRRVVLAVGAAIGLGSWAAPVSSHTSEDVTRHFSASPDPPAFGPIQLAEGNGPLNMSFAVGRAGVDAANGRRGQMHRSARPRRRPYGLRNSVPVEDRSSSPPHRMEEIIDDPDQADGDFAGIALSQSERRAGDTRANPVAFHELFGDCMNAGRRPEMTSWADQERIS